MFELGVFLLVIGYAGFYTGAANLHNGGIGPTFAQSLGFKAAVAPPGADQAGTGLSTGINNLAGGV